MNWSDESQWDETTCDSAVCQHPQCWAATRRIERGHPRMLNSPCKTFLDTEDKLPVLTIVNVSDSCHLPERLAQHHSSGFTFTKTYSSLPRHSKFDSKIKTAHGPSVVLQGSLHRCVTKLDSTLWLTGQDRASVLNLNKTLLPCHQHVSNMAVIWIPEKPEQHKSFLKDEDKAVTSSDIKIALTMMKKNSPLDKSRPESAVSSKMFLSVHRLTLQSPGLRHPEHLKKLHYGLMTKPVLPKAARLPGPTKSQQQQQRRRKGKISTKKQESEIKQQQIELEGPALKQVRLYQDATEEPDRNHPDNYPAFFPRRKSPTELIKTEFIKKDIGSQVEVGLEFQTSSEEEILKNLTARIAGITWNPEFKLLRLLQASDDEDVEDQSSRTPSEQSLEAQAGSMTWGNQDA
ncbi:uncharacterized protein C9orf43 homolog [Rhynchocyon petersi]